MNEYRVIVSFGDGNPKNTIIKAKSGYAAQEEAAKLNPAARSIHVLGFATQQKEQCNQNNHSHLIFGCELTNTPAKQLTCITFTGPHSEVRAREDKAKMMYGDGHTRTEIAKALGVSLTTIRRYLKSTN